MRGFNHLSGSLHVLGEAQLLLVMARSPAEPLTLPVEERVALEEIVAAPSNPHRMVREARGLLMAGDGLANAVITERLDVSRSTVLGWRAQFVDDGVAGVARVRPGRKATIPAAKVDEIVRATQNETPPEATHWSVRSMAAAQGVGRSTVHKIWRARGLKPHLVETFKLSNNPDIDDKLVDVVALYMNPPENAVVLGVDEKSQVQALDRTQPGLPLKPGRAGTMTHDYKRNGTTTLFAALNVLTGAVLGKCLPRRRHQEFLTFLLLINRRVPKTKQIHLIRDNHATHNRSEVKAWLAEHPRFHLHFTPTSSSWLNLVERWFRELTSRRLARGSFASVDELVAAIESYVAHHNDNPKPFVWTKTADGIMAKVRRGRVALDQARAISKTHH